MSTAGPPVPTNFRAELGSALLCASVAMLLAVAPHLAALATSGSAVYLGDGDDVFYTALSRSPYRGEWGLSDPFQPADSPRLTLYPPLPFVPTAMLARWLGLDRLLIPLVWRVLGGLLLGLSAYTVFRVVLAGTKRPTAWALGCALIAIADAGFVGGQTLFGSFGLVRAMFRGTTPMDVPNALGQFRVVTPLLTLPPLLALSALMVPPLRFRPRTWLEVVAGAVLLGLCVHLYFFFWTAAVVALLMCLDRAFLKNDRAERNFLVLVLIGGAAIGAPQLIADTRAFSDPALKPILQRTHRGRVLSADDPARMRYLVNLWAYAKLAFGAAVVVGLAKLPRQSSSDTIEPEKSSEHLSPGAAGCTQPVPPASSGARVPSTVSVAPGTGPSRGEIVPEGWRLATLGAFAASGFLLVNSAIVTGLEFENFHWVYVHAPFGEILVLAGVALLLDRMSWNIAGRWLWALPVAVVTLAAVWRPYEALKNPEAVLYTETLRGLLPLRPELRRLGRDDVIAGPWPAVNVALLLTDSGQLYQYDQTMHSTLAPLQEVHERKALNAWLNGMSLQEYLDEIGREEHPSGPSEVESREAIYRKLLSGKFDDLLARYRPTHLIRPETQGSPNESRGGPWILAGSRGGWMLWRREGSH